MDEVVAAATLITALYETLSFAATLEILYAVFARLKVQGTAESTTNDVLLVDHGFKN